MAADGVVVNGGDRADHGKLGLRQQRVVGHGYIGGRVTVVDYGQTK